MESGWDRRPDFVRVVIQTRVINLVISVGMDGNYAIVGAQQGDSGNGSAYIFYKSGTTWSQQAKLVASDKANDDVFGDDVDISGDYAIVGARQNDDNGASNSGSVYIFKRDVDDVDRTSRASLK